MAAAAAALANSLGAASCGMGSPGGGPQSNPLLGQYAALLGMGRNPSGGPGDCFPLLPFLSSLQLSSNVANVLVHFGSWQLLTPIAHTHCKK